MFAYYVSLGLRMLVLGQLAVLYPALRAGLDFAAPWRRAAAKPLPSGDAYRSRGRRQSCRSCRRCQLLFGLHDIRTLVGADPAGARLELCWRSERVDLVVRGHEFLAPTRPLVSRGRRTVSSASGRQQPDLARGAAHGVDSSWSRPCSWSKTGAADYIGKPWQNDKLLASGGESYWSSAEVTSASVRSCSRRNSCERRATARGEQYELQRHRVCVGCHGKRVVELACRVARAPDVRVLITGPNGAGKERIAQILHANSAVAQAAPSWR